MTIMTSINNDEMIMINNVCNDDERRINDSNDNVKVIVMM